MIGMLPGTPISRLAGWRTGRTVHRRLPIAGHLLFLRLTVAVASS